MKPEPCVNVKDMKIACICDDRFPSTAANTQQVIKTAAAVARLGVHIDLVLPRMWQTVWMDKSQRRRLLDDYYAVTGPYGLRQLVSWIPTPLRFHKISHGVVGPLATWLTRYDVVYTRNFLPILLGLATGQLIVFETYRLLGKHYPILKKPMNRVARHPRFLGLVTHSSLARENMIEVGLPPDKVEVIHNGFDPEDMEPRLTRHAARRQLNRSLGWSLDPARPVVTYAGRIDPDKGIGVLLDIMSALPEAQLVLVGATQRRHPGWLNNRAAARGLKNVFRAQRVDPKELAPFLYAADALIIPPTRGPLETQGNTVLPIKTFSYLGAGRPVLAPHLPDTAELLEDDHNALLVEPDNPQAAASALSSLFADPKRWNRLAQNAALDGQRLTWQARAEKFVAYLDRRVTAYRQGQT
jgi:glycosyltransferase involved in cell wall biosynthesis